MATYFEEIVYDEIEPVRVDRLLVKHFSGISRAYLQNIIERGGVKINDRIARKGSIVSKGHRVVIESFPRPEERQIEPNLTISIDIVWQDKNLAILNKQAGLPTHPNDFEDKNTLANAFLARFPSVIGVGDDRLRPGIVHRLDTDTSGLLMVAKTQEMFAALRELFDARKVKKTYQALVLGEISQAGEINTPLAHHPKNPRKMIAVKKGMEIGSRIREAGTLYEPIARYGSYTLLKVQTKTGRMHQVRVHLSSIGHPLVGDRLYQSAHERQSDRVGLKRHFLHATRLEFPLPFSTELKSFEIPLSPDLLDALEKVGKG